MDLPRHSLAASTTDSLRVGWGKVAYGGNENSTRKRKGKIGKVRPKENRAPVLFRPASPH